MNNNVSINMELTNKPLVDIKYDSYLVIKRVGDITISLFVVTILIPIAFLIKIANILNKDYGKLIYKQERIGENGKLFTLYKFRSMSINADEELNNILKNEKYKQEYDLNKKINNDPRVTKVGSFIRKTSIDELPQIINVIKGEMSLVGNRPYLPREKDDMGVYYNNIVKTKPGITGLWQISGRSKTTFNKRLEFENYYSNNRSLLMDYKILVKTFKTVILGKDAK